MKKIENVFRKNNWKNISEDFTSELRNQWESRGFSFDQVREWIGTEISPQDVEFCAWLRDDKKLSPERVKNNGDKKQRKKSRGRTY